MTNYGFVGPMTDMSTVFDAKAESAGSAGATLPLLGVGCWLFWIQSTLR